MGNGRLLLILLLCGLWQACGGLKLIDVSKVPRHCNSQQTSSRKFIQN